MNAPGGAGYLPDPAYGTGAQARRSGQQSTRGTLAEAELAFQVPSGATDLRLAFDPSGKRGAHVVAPLGV